jgi:hypothetical protein
MTERRIIDYVLVAVTLYMSKRSPTRADKRVLLSSIRKAIREAAALERKAAAE